MDEGEGYIAICKAGLAFVVRETDKGVNVVRGGNDTLQIVAKVPHLGSSIKSASALAGDLDVCNDCLKEIHRCFLLNYVEKD